jgi:U4/U6.U5 tri-snRNP-associated protein 2
VALQLVSRLDADVSWVRALDGSEFMPGLVGLNNMKANDYANAVVQVLARVNPIRCVCWVCDG